MFTASSIFSDTEHGPLYSFQKIPPSTFSPETLDLAYQWYKDCVDTHENCQKTPLSKSRWMPTRLIDIGNTNEWFLKLADEDLVSAPSPSYMTLSYRWSPEPRILLLSSSMNEFRRGVSYERLPQTFRDFIQVVRRFHVRYVWIDSLCIVQDSRDDWETEAPKMRYVYGNSVCTIAASAADSHSGMSHSRTAENIQPGIIEASNLLPGSRQYFMLDENYWKRHLHSGALHSRGWAFQEMILAPRVLYFSRKQILWECLTEHKCEGFPHGIPFHESSKSIDSLMLVEPNDKTSLHAPMQNHTLQHWMDLVDKYSHCDFTNPEDKLWAFSGIAELFSEAAGGRYFAGLWESRLLDTMDWRVNSRRPRLSLTYRAPSWSWASIDGPVFFDLPCFRYHHLVEILEVKIEPTKGNYLGGISDAFLRLKGPLVTAKCEVQKNFKLKIDIDPNPILVSAFPDTTETQLVQNGQIFILLFRLQQLGIFQEQHLNHDGKSFDCELLCLTLEAVPGEENVFRRTGYFIIHDEGSAAPEKLQDAATVREITMV